jgi:flap endonuclease-1
MGIPYIEAPSEAEAQCAIMAASGLVYGVISKDMVLILL